MNAIILAGGAGRRLYPLTRGRPKALLKVGGRPLYHYTLDMLRETRGSLGNVILVAPRGAPGILSEAPGWISIVEQKGDGVEGALLTGLEAVGGGSEVVVSFIGYVARPSTMVKHLLDYYSTTEYPLAITVAPVTSGLETFGFTRIGPRGNVEAIEPSPGPEWMKGRGYVFAGALVGEFSFIQRLAEEGFTRGLNMFASKGLVGALTWTGEWIELSYPWDLLNLPSFTVSGSLLLVSNRAEVSRSATLQGPVVVEDRAVIGEEAVILGPAYIGREVRVGEGSVVGPNVSLEEGSVVGSLSIVKDSILMEGSLVGHQAVVERSIIGPEARVGHQSILEPGDLDPMYPWVRDAIEKAGRIRLGAVLGPGASMPHRGYASGRFIE